MKRRKILVVLVALVGAHGAAQQAQRAPDPILDADRLIMEEIEKNNEVMMNLEYLTDMIGPRVTGTKQMDRASRWTSEVFQKYGLVNPHLEPWTIANAWYRGTAFGRMVSPAEHSLWIVSAGWSPSTNGRMRGAVVHVNARRVEELDQYKGKLKGKIVITAEPSALPAPYEAPRSPVLSPYGPPAGPAAQQFGPAFQQFSRARDAFFKAEGVAVVLRDSVKEHGLVNMTGIGGRDYNIGAVPTAFITSEGYRLIWRFMQRGPVEVEIEIKNSFSEKPVEVYNTVA